MGNEVEEEVEVKSAETPFWTRVATTDATMCLILMHLVVHHVEAEKNGSYKGIQCVAYSFLKVCFTNKESKFPAYLIDRDFNCIHRRISLFVIGCVHHNLVKDFVKTRNKADVALYELLLCVVQDPHGLCDTFRGADWGRGTRKRRSEFRR